jgi:hypothetical protein
VLSLTGEVVESMAKGAGVLVVLEGDIAGVQQLD